MYIFDDIVWEKKDDKEHLWINKPCDFYGLPNKPEVADIKRANMVADYDLLTARLADIQKMRMDDSVTNCRVALADKASKLRGYGAGLGLIGLFSDMPPLLYLPQRDLGAPGDRLVWDICSGRTMTKDESPNWFHRIVVEGLEEITFMLDGNLELPSLHGMEFMGISNEDAQRIVRRNAEILGHRLKGENHVSFEYVALRNSPIVHCVTESSNLNVKAGWGVEAKYSGLELMAYGILRFGVPYPADVSVYDSEEFAPGKVCGREIHEINSSTGKVKVFQHGKAIRIGTVGSEIERRNQIRAIYDYCSKDRRGMMPIPEYSASVKADLLTKPEAWPFNSDISALKDIQYRG